MGNPPESEKAVRYISQLDEARCAGRWGDVPELCRKVEKHAPHRRCLTLTARSEAQISAYSNQRPSTSASTATSGLSKIIPSLLTAIDEEGERAQDAFQATVCLGWLHYVLEEPGLAVARLPKDFASVASNLSTQGGPLSGWSRVCIIKGAFLKGSSHDRAGAVDEAVQTYHSVLSWLNSLKDIGTESILFKMWTERLLVRLCQLSNQSQETGDALEPEEALQAYRFWAKYCETTGAGAVAEGMAIHRRSAWKAYYDTLSIILQHSLPFDPESSSVAPSAVNGTGKPSAKLQQRAELKRVENIYENLLLKETHFPKASENNQEIETWTDAVMSNWRLLCGPTWSDEDLGEGGKEAVSRGVLDILYRAAAKTFHSTPILRHLFVVHASLAEFDLAFKAYDSYVEIIARGKDRDEKSGEEDLGLDDDSTILCTSAEAIRILCRYGSRKEAEKALGIGSHIEKWCEQIQHMKSATSGTGSPQLLETVIDPRALAVAYCAIGISQAQWARFTYDADSRTAIQTRAVHYLRRSLEPRFENPSNIEALYALGLVLAEMRDIPGAIKVVKRALSPVTRHKTTKSVDGFVTSGLATEFGRERKLIPVWHLLALLLTTRSEFTAAEKACEAAFEQFGDPTMLFGKEEEDAAYRSEHLNEVNGKTLDGKAVGIVDQMESFEKSGILQVKMTQLALVEIVEGPTLAVDGCDELLALYARLFGNQAAERAKLQPPTPVAPPPKSAVGTIRGSIFRSKGSGKSPIKNDVARNSSIASSRNSTVATQTTAAPTIQVTDENGADHARGRHHHHLFQHKHEEDRPGVTRTPSKLQKRSANSLRRRSAQQAEQVADVSTANDTATNGTPTRNSTSRTKSPRRPSMSSSLRKSLESGDRPLRGIQHTMSQQKDNPLIGHAPHGRVRSQTPFPGASYIPPDPRFSILQDRRHKISLLVDIWVFISGLYMRAEMYEDAKGAVSEALTLIETFEAEVAQENSTSGAFASKGWGGGRSVEELWAKVFTARGELMAAQALIHEARADFERAVLHHPDHPEAIVGLSNILLDIYCKVVSLEPDQELEANASPSPPSVPSISDASSETKTQHLASHTPSAENQISPPELNRLAARDRAFGLLSTLTKLGAGWDYSEAWYALARAYEESGQIEKTKEVLWWCVELEDTHPVRSWKNVALGGFVL